MYAIIAREVDHFGIPNKERKMTKFKSLIAGLFISLGLMTSAAHATPYVGSVSADSGGLGATNPWDDGFFFNATFKWNVYESAGKWFYDYALAVPRKEISYYIIEVGETFTAANILGGTSSGWQLGTWSTGSSNPGMTDDIYGLKFTGNGFLDLTRIVSDIAPMWGDLYARDGVYRNHPVYALTDNFGTDTNASIAGHAPAGYIMTPGNKVPEPGTLALLSIAMLGAGYTTMRKKKPMLPSSLKTA